MRREIVLVPRCADFRKAALRNKGKKCIALWFTGEHFDSLLPAVAKVLPKEGRRSRFACKSGFFEFRCALYERSKGLLQG